MTRQPAALFGRSCTIRPCSLVRTTVELTSRTPARRSTAASMGEFGQQGGRQLWHTEVDGARSEVMRPGDLGKLVLGSGNADLESFHLAEPSALGRLGDALGEVVPDSSEPLVLGGVNAQECAPHAGVFVDAGDALPPPPGVVEDLADRARLGRVQKRSADVSFPRDGIH
jgi:hypothetical protein